MMEISAIDVKNSCRTCLTSEPNLESVFDSNYQGKSFAFLLGVIAPINIAKNDGLSEFICEGCKINLITSFRFQELCINSDKNIRILIEKSIHHDLSQTTSIKTERDLVDEEVNANIAEQLSVSISNDTSSCINLADDEVSELQQNIAENEDSQTEMIQQLTAGATAMIEGESDEGETSENDDSDEDYGMDESFDCEEEKDTQPEFKCELCVDKVFSTLAKLARHQKSHEPGKKRKISQSSSKNSAEIDEDESDGEDKTYECKLCPKVFKKPSLLSRHVKTHDPNKRPFECNKCDKRFQSQVALVRHDILHSDLVERSKLIRNEAQDFTCVVCSKIFKTPESLTSHIKGHKSDPTQIQQFSCRLCMEIFATLTDLVKHSKNHIENATHQCIVSLKYFSIELCL